MDFGLLMAVLLLFKFQTYGGKICHCSRVRIKVDVYGLTLTTVYELDKTSSSDGSEYKNIWGDNEFLFKSQAGRWNISSKKDKVSYPSIYSDCHSNCPHDCPRWKRQERDGNPQNFAVTLAKCEGKYPQINDNYLNH